MGPESRLVSPHRDSSALGTTELKRGLINALLVDPEPHIGPLERFNQLLQRFDLPKNCKIPRYELMGLMFRTMHQLGPLILAQRGAPTSPLSSDVFRAPPESTRLDSLQYFTLVGWDLKIDAANQPWLIEMNGLNSGMRGFARTQTDVHLGDAVQGRADKALDRYLEAGYGAGQLAYLGTQLVLHGTALYRLPQARGLIDEYRNQAIDCLIGVREHAALAVHPDWHRYDCHVEHLRRAETLLGNKLNCDRLFDRDRDIKALSLPATPASVMEVLDLYGPRFVVVKPVDGLQGNGVQVIPAREAFTLPLPDCENALVEPFIESRPIWCPETSAYHDGCMRVISLVERSTDGAVRQHLFGGYWRLAPLPIDRYGEPEAMRANLSKHAFAVRASESDLEVVRPLIERATERLSAALEEHDADWDVRTLPNVPPAA